jgi:hypothetical protein
LRERVRDIPGFAIEWNRREYLMWNLALLVPNKRHARGERNSRNKPNRSQESE